jgi:hypothetical protein
MCFPIEGAMDQVGRRMKGKMKEKNQEDAA